MIDLFDRIDDLVSIEKIDRRHTDDRQVFLLHLECESFLILDRGYGIIGEGKDKFFYREFNFRTCPTEYKYFLREARDRYQDLIRGF